MRPIEFIVGIVLVFDILCFMTFFIEYCWYARILGSLKPAPELPIFDCLLESHVRQQKYEKVPYAVLRGKVTAIGAPIKSGFFAWVTEVLQKVIVLEKKEPEKEQRKLVDFSTHEQRFMLTNGGHGVKVEVEGFQTTEQILREGSLVTAVGEIILNAGNLQLQPSSVGPFFLTTKTKFQLVEHLKKEKFAAGAGCVFTVVVFGIIIFAAWYFGYMDEKREGSAGTKSRTETDFERKEINGGDVNKPKKKQKRKGNRSKKQRVLVPL